MSTQSEQYVRIFDTTLRDGEQSPGISLNAQEKLEIARQLERLGVAEIESRVALRRLGTVEDCAKVVEFLATDLSDYVSGAVVPIDGGSTRWAG